MRGSFFLRLTGWPLLDANYSPTERHGEVCAEIAGELGTSLPGRREARKNCTLRTRYRGKHYPVRDVDGPADCRRIRKTKCNSVIHGGTSKIRIGRAPQGGGAQPCSLVSLQGRGPVKACLWQRGAWALTGSRACGIGGADVDRCDLRTLTGNQLFGV